MAFWKKFYKSKYTGAEIDAAVAKAGDATKVTANPTLAGTEAALTGLEVGETKYKVEQPINVVANPTLAGTEAALTGLEVGDTKYKVEQPINVVANPTLAGTEAALEGLQVGATKYKVIDFITAPESLMTRIDTALTGMAVALTRDTKYHKQTITIQTTDTDYTEIAAYIDKLDTGPQYPKITDCGTLGHLIVAHSTDDAGNANIVLSNYLHTAIGLGHLILTAYHASAANPVVIDFYAQKLDVASS